MRVENNNLAEITQTKNKVEMKGNVTVSVEETTACKVEKNTGKVTSVQQTTVDRPFFSGESQLDQISQEAENMELQVMQEKIKAVSNALSEGDCEKLEEDGYTVNGCEVDIDYWPGIPTYLEIEGPSEDAVYHIVDVLGFKKEDCTSLDVQGIYKSYGIELDKIDNLKLEEERK